MSTSGTSEQWTNPWLLVSSWKCLSCWVVYKGPTVSCL